MVRKWIAAGLVVAAGLAGAGYVLAQVAFGTTTTRVVLTTTEQAVTISGTTTRKLMVKQQIASGGSAYRICFGPAACTDDLGPYILMRAGETYSVDQISVVNLTVYLRLDSDPSGAFSVHSWGG